MSDYTIDLGGARCLSVRLFSCWRGAWVAYCDLDPDSSPVTSGDVPSGKVTLTIAPPSGSPIVLTGFVDPDASGRMVSGVQVRLVGGYGWGQPVDKQHFHSDSGVSALSVEQATAAAVGETVVDASPPSLGVDWVRMAGPAAAVFGDRDWYVDTSGVTQVASRPAASPDASVEILEWEPDHQHGTLSADALVLPGTQLTDVRFDGPITVRDTIQTWDASGTRVEIWCGSNAASRQVLALLRSAIRSLGGVVTLKRYRYRIVSQIAASSFGPSRLVLQSVPNPDGSATDAPNLSPVSIAPGMSGLTATFATSSLVTVAFINGDPRQPIVESFDSTAIPSELTVDASGTLSLGPSASAVDIAGGGQGAARGGDTVVVMLPPNVPVAGSVVIGGATVPIVGVMTVTQPLVGTIVTFSSKVACG